MFQVGGLLVAGTKLAAARQHAGRRLPRPDDERAIGGKQLAVAGDELQAAADRLRQPQRGRQPIDEPRAAQQPPHKRLILGSRLDEPIGPAHHAGLGRKIDVIERRERLSGYRASEIQPGRPTFSGCRCEPIRAVGRPT